jgi:hypothetical protein
VSGVTFQSGRIVVPPNRLQKVILAAEHDDDRFEARHGGIAFRARGWYEILLTVAWDAANVDGTRFSHTAITDNHPLHSEAIDASVLARLSDGKQLLRGNTIFEPGRVDHVMLEVWQDSPRPIEVRYASLEVRDLDSTD